MAKKPDKPQRKEKPQTRVKQSQAAKKRQRKHGQFASGRIYNQPPQGESGLRIFQLRHPLTSIATHFLPAEEEGRNKADQEAERRKAAFENLARGQKTGDEEGTWKPSGAKVPPPPKGPRGKSRIGGTPGNKPESAYRTSKAESRPRNIYEADPEYEDLMGASRVSKNYPGVKLPDESAKQMGKEIFTRQRQFFKKQGVSDDTAADLALRDTMEYMRGEHNTEMNPADPDVFGADVHYKQMSSQDMLSDYDNNFETMSSSYPGAPRVTDDEVSLDGGNLGTLSVDKFFQAAGPREQQWMDQQRQSSSSPFYRGAAGGKNATARRRESKYWQARKSGASGERSTQLAMQDNRGAPKSGRQQSMESLANKAVQKRKNPQAVGQKGQRQGFTGSHESFKYGMRGPGVDSIDELKRQHPNFSNEELVALRAKIEEKTSSEFEKNAKWNHEQRLQRMGAQNGKEAETNRVVFFTTSMGWPAPSVPANSLLGQYIIRQRKSMLVNDKAVTDKSRLKGPFPDEVRDRHLVEIATGLSFGAQGRLGVFHNTGAKFATKRTQGFGKQTPLGARILRDSAGNKVFDDKGNVRYTEGYTRPFAVGTDNLGFRIFVG